MATHTTTVRQVYSTPHAMNGWALLNSINAWRRVGTTSADGHTNTFLALSTARDLGNTVTVVTDAADQLITAVYV